MSQLTSNKLVAVLAIFTSMVIICLFFKIPVTTHFIQPLSEQNDDTLPLTNKQNDKQMNEQKSVTVKQTPKVQRSGAGYMFALEFSDQGTGSFVNAITLLCFASKIGVKVVEPFMTRSRFGLNISANWSEEIRFRDVFDLETAHKFASKGTFGKLVPFDEFLKDAPRKLLVAQHKCTILCSIPCGHPDALEPGRIFSKTNGFEVVGQVCLDHKTSGKTTLKEIESQLYKDYDKSEVVVMFLHFGGVDGGTFKPSKIYRLIISTSPSCYRANCYQYNYIRPSKLVEKSAQRYLDTHLSGKRYVSVMIRLQMVLGNHKNWSDFTKSCLDRVHKRVQEIMSKVGIGQIFLCLDVGKYGSDWVDYYGSIMNPVMHLYDSFVSKLIGDGMTLADLDRTFTKTTLIDNPGFVAMMQKTIAARGEVLVLVGGGHSNYQKSALEFYRSLHRNKEKVFQLGNSCQ